MAGSLKAAAWRPATVTPQNQCSTLDRKVRSLKAVCSVIWNLRARQGNGQVIKLEPIFRYFQRLTIFLFIKVIRRVGPRFIPLGFVSRTTPLVFCRTVIPSWFPRFPWFPRSPWLVFLSLYVLTPPFSYTILYFSVHTPRPEFCLTPLRVNDAPIFLDQTPAAVLSHLFTVRADLISVGPRLNRLGFYDLTTVHHHCHHITPPTCAPLPGFLLGCAYYPA